MLLFHYPTTQPSALDYLQRSVKLEFGSLTEQRPTASHPVRPWIAEVLPEASGTGSATSSPWIFIGRSGRRRPYFTRSTIAYDLAVPPTLRLLPPPEREAALRRDYQAMRDTYLSEPTPFEEILVTLTDVERQLNGN